jgi:hypothetical protein
MQVTYVAQDKRLVVHRAARTEAHIALHALDGRVVARLVVPAGVAAVPLPVGSDGSYIAVVTGGGERVQRKITTQGLR